MNLNKLDRCKLDTLVKIAKKCYPALEWDHEDKWCRYCGARVSSEWGCSPWGPEKLCWKHSQQWENGKLFLEAFEDEEPTTVSDVINSQDCDEKQVLINLILNHYNRYGDPIYV